jgi:multiple sugar transport system ATP-binding protein
MAQIELRNITKHFGGITAVNNLNLTVQDGEFFVLLGPTGAGKSTTLRVISGLDSQDSGSLFFDGQQADALTPAERDVAFVFQYYSLYPTMSVFDNLAFPLRAPGRNFPANAIKQRVEEVAARVRITHLLQRATKNLSGGEMQRVAIGRALVREPRAYLMDEPLSNLDAKLREALRTELGRLQREKHSTTVFVTHDQIEAMTMADRIGVLREGVLVQVGTPREIYDAPADTFVAKLVGVPRINLLQAEMLDGRVRLPDNAFHVSPPPGASMPRELILGFRPEDVVILPEGSAGEVVLVEPLGVETIIHVRCGAQIILATVTGLSDLKLGMPIRFGVRDERLHYFDRVSGRRL